MGCIVTQDPRRADNPAMAHPPHTPSRQHDKVDTDLLIKGILVALIGLAVLVAPAFMADGELRATVAASYLVGWFALVLGCVFIAQYAARLWSRRHLGGKH